MFNKKTVVLAGRPNVGKSTLFNRITKSRSAIVGNESGLTRDRHYSTVTESGVEFFLVDTGGLDTLVDSGVQAEMTRQSRQAIDEADLVLFLVDVREGLTFQDHAISKILRKVNAQVWVIVNKAEGMSRDAACVDFYELGLGDPLVISSAHGDGVGELVSLVTSAIGNREDQEGEIIQRDDSLYPKMAVVGRPNVGKSTLVNSILGEERVIAYDQPGTTRDSIEIEFERENSRYLIVDTAGVRRRGKVDEKIEKFSVIKALQSVDQSNVVLLVLDSTEGVTDQDVSLAAYAIESGRAMVVVFNKWDLCSADAKSFMERSFSRKLGFLDFARVHRLSAKSGSGIKGLLKSVDQAFRSARANLPTPKLSRVLKLATERQTPPRKGYSRPKLRYAHQGGMNPPLVVIHGNSLNQIPDSYRRYLEGFFAEAFKLRGTPLKISFKQSENPFLSRDAKRRKKR